MSEKCKQNLLDNFQNLGENKKYLGEKYRQMAEQIFYVLFFAAAKKQFKYLRAYVRDINKEDVEHVRLTKGRIEGYSGKHLETMKLAKS